MTRVAFDSNILVYLADGKHTPEDAVKVARVRQLYRQLFTVVDFVAPVQSTAEAFKILIQKSGFSDETIDAIFGDWQDSFETLPTEWTTLRDGISLARLHRLQHWDALIICAAAEGRCSILLSEDMQHGFVWRGLTIVNPFADPPHPLLASLL